MKIYDPLYGPFDTPSFIDGLIFAPEVRRLSTIRLLNTITPTIPTLGDISRFTHTLGVVYLCKQNSFFGFSDKEVRALFASVLIHDAGTPPFAHLFEYFLREKFNWDHESIITDFLQGIAAPENIAQQIYKNKTRRYSVLCQKSKIDFDLVMAIVGKKHALSKVLFGELDLDNLDNVARMGWAMGLRKDVNFAVKLAENIGISPDGEIFLDECNIGYLNDWATTRKTVYSILNFDPLTVSAQAILTHAIGLAMRERVFDVNDWIIEDDNLIDRLTSNKVTKSIIQKEYFGGLPEILFFIRIKGELGNYGLKTRSEAIELIEKNMSRYLKKESVLGYCFIDKGTFSKKLKFYCHKKKEKWEFGETSRSIILYGFARKGLKVKKETSLKIFNDLVREVFNEESILEYKNF